MWYCIYIPNCSLPVSNVQELLQSPDHTHCLLEATSTTHKLHPLTVLQFPSPAARFLVTLTESVDTPQPQFGFSGWSQCLSAEPAIIPASCPVFSYKLHSSGVLFSLRILHNLYLFAQCQLDVCFSAWTIFSFQNILHFREAFEQLFWEEIKQSISTQKLSCLLFLFSLWGHPMTCPEMTEWGSYSRWD